MRTKHQPALTARRRERGSLFLVVLIVLFLVTAIGLSMVAVSETELLLASSEWVISETHFAAESGMATQIAQLLVTNDSSPVDVVLPSYFGQLDNNSQFGFDLKSSGLFPLSYDEMPYTKANMGSQGQLFSAYLYTHVRARRVAWPEGQAVPTCYDIANRITGQKHLTNGFYYSPIEPLQADALIKLERAALDENYGRSSADGALEGAPIGGTGGGAWAMCDARVGEAPLHELILESDNSFLDPDGTPPE